MTNESSPLRDDCREILVSEAEIQSIVSRLAREIEETYEHSPRQLVMVVILKGSFVFAADLMKQIRLPLQVEFMRVSSYGASTKSSGEIKVSLDLQRDDLRDIDLLIVEDIVDSGRTLARLTELMRHRNAHSVRACTLLDKPSCREVDFVPDFTGTRIPDRFVVGYGLDFNEKYRNLPFIGVLREEICRA